MLDQRWHLIAGIELCPDFCDEDSSHRGVVRARPHPTGWFVSAHHRPNLAADDAAHLVEFARVRAYLLLTAGPTEDTWRRGLGEDDWIAYWDVDELDRATPIPDAVPAGWR